MHLEKERKKDDLDLDSITQFIGKRRKRENSLPAHGQRTLAAGNNSNNKPTPEDSSDYYDDNLDENVKATTESPGWVQNFPNFWTQP